tara:strand:+ start:11460 stop:12962 length:1503 start_codon:yes stop_codon:yes gene_type:complete
MGSKNILVLGLLAALLAAFGLSVGLREHGNASATAASAVSSRGALGADDKAKAKDKPTGTKASESLKATNSDSEKTATAEAVTPIAPPMDRQIRTIAYGWDLMAPGLLGSKQDKSNAKSFQGHQLDVAFTAADNLSDVKAALALGGADKDGADIAIVPLPEMVAAYEDLRALEPEIFFIVGWSRGRDAVYGMNGKTLIKPRSSAKAPVKLAGESGKASTLLALYLLDLAGVPPKDIQLVTDTKKADFVARNRASDEAAPENSRVLMTSADAHLLVPYVAIAPAGFLKNRRATRAWLAGWLEGVEELRNDVPSAARKVAAVEGAPETIDLVRQLGQIDFAGLDGNVRRAGLSGRDAVTLDELFKLTWHLWRSAGVVTTPTPNRVPFSSEGLAALVLASSTKPSTDAPRTGDIDFSTAPIIRIQLKASKDTDAHDRSMKRIALVSGIFSDSALRLGSKRAKKATTEEIESLVSRFGLNASRFQADHRLSKKNTTTLEVLATP